MNVPYIQKQSEEKIETNYIHKDVIVINEIIQNQREFFQTGTTADVAYRINALKRLRDAVVNNESKILTALYEDLGKPEFEAYISELAVFYQELKHTMAHIKKWAKSIKVKTPWRLQPGSGRVLPEPFGMVLIIGPWNYPVQLTLVPLIGAIAAGNTAIVKPSEVAVKTSKIIVEIIREAFDRSYVAVVEGGVDISRSLLKNRFDYIFFTGGAFVGKKIMEAAAQHLIPLTLELGGKSPVIVHDDASVDVAAKRITWGKFLNAGQTCLAPDYVLVQKKVKKQLIERIIFYIKEFYGDNPLQSKDYARIINAEHFNRLQSLLKKGRILYGGETRLKKKYIAPTLIDEPSLKYPVMQEEIFGPILPVLGYAELSDALATINKLPKPLAVYLFSDSEKTIDTVTKKTSSGSLCINDTVIQVSNPNLPFGGVGASGLGSYHGWHSFATFSHMKSIFKKAKLFDIPFRFPPYKKNINLLRKIFR